ncbi:helix-turn-helix domain-containing protein [Streptomyces sp. NPDC056883]|uniref:helix-turn-helix transcriptional regulator n=1 Tax=Streptomyces sp. NPDC056883 TaxID=3345959 RepID=UPI0036987DDF
MNFGFGAPVRTRGMAGERTYSESPSRVDLPATVAVRADHEGDVRGVVVRMRPMGAYRLFGVPMSEWHQTDLDPSDLLPHGLRHLPRMLEEADAQGRAAILDAALPRLMAGHRGAQAVRIAPEIMLAWHELHRTQGRIRIGRLAAQLLWSRRHLERRFREQIGHPPGAIARVLRLTHAFRLQLRGVPLAKVAVLAGFHDQAHFSHTVREATGLTPGRLPLGGAGPINWQAEPAPAAAGTGTEAGGDR